VFQEDQFQPLIVAFSRFPIVRRVQIEQGQRFRWTPDIYRVRLQSLDSHGSCLFGPIGVDLDAIAMGGHIVEQVSECRSISHAGIEYRELGRVRCERERVFQTSRFRRRQREKSQLELSVWSHLYSPVSQIGICATGARLGPLELQYEDVRWGLVERRFAGPNRCPSGCRWNMGCPP